MKKATAIRQNGKNAGIKIQSKREKIFDAALNVFGVILVAIILYPIYYVFIASISRPLPVENGSVILAPVGVTLESYRQALKTPYLGTALLNSLYYTFGGVLVNMVFSTTMAYALSKKRLVGRKIFTLFTVFSLTSQTSSVQSNFFSEKEESRLSFMEEFSLNSTFFLQEHIEKTAKNKKTQNEK